MVPVNKELLRVTVPVYRKLLTGILLVNNLLTATVPVNNIFLYESYFQPLKFCSFQHLKCFKDLGEAS